MKKSIDTRPEEATRIENSPRTPRTPDASGLPFRTVVLCTSVWARSPARLTTRMLAAGRTAQEISSCSNFEALSGRRAASVSARQQDELPHTLNGKRPGVGRTWVRIIETTIPAEGAAPWSCRKVLRPYSRDQVIRNRALTGWGKVLHTAAPISRSIRRTRFALVRHRLRNRIRTDAHRSSEVLGERLPRKPLGPVRSLFAEVESESALAVGADDGPFREDARQWTAAP